MDSGQSWPPRFLQVSEDQSLDITLTAQRAQQINIHYNKLIFITIDKLTSNQWHCDSG